MKAKLAAPFLLTAAVAVAGNPLLQDPPPTATTGATGATGATGEQEPQGAGTRVVVTAQKWGEESVKDVPQSVTPITAAMIRDAGMTSIADAARHVPGMFVTGFSARRLSFPFIRGVGSGQGDPAVATFVDDVPQLSVSNTNLSLAGISRIEFMRGPNSALWGRNTIGGAINMLTRRPSFRPQAEFNATLGNYDSQVYDVHATGPVIKDVLSASFSGSYEMRDGFTTNAFSGNDVDSRDSAFGRLQLQWAPAENSIVRLILHGEETRDGGFVLSDLAGLRTDAFRINQDFEGKTDRDIAAATLIWNRSDDLVDFVSITSVQGWDIDESADFDFSQLDGVRRFTNEEQDYVYQEFRFESAAGAPGAKWLVGVSGFYSDEKRAATNVFRPGGAGIIFPPANVGSDISSGSFKDTAFSAFGQIGLDCGCGWDFTAALRYDYESKDADINRVFDTGAFVVPVAASMRDESYDKILPRGSIGYRICDDASAYLTAARGFKAGGFNLTSPSGQEAFGPESSWTYEIGAKTEWCGDRVTANFALFFIDWEDMQLSQFDATAGGYVTNAGQSTSRGVEFEVSARPCERLELFGSAGFMDTEFDSFLDQFGQSVAGNDLPFAPELTASFGGQYTHDLDGELNAFARVDVFHTGDFYYDAGNRSSESFSLANFRLGVGGETWRVDTFLANAFDEEYVPIAFQANPADPTMFVGSSGAPMTYGLTGRIRF